MHQNAERRYIFHSIDLKIVISILYSPYLTKFLGKKKQRYVQNVEVDLDTNMHVDRIKKHCNAPHITASFVPLIQQMDPMVSGSERILICINGYDEDGCENAKSGK